jgi:kynurenine formamidase
MFIDLTQGATVGQLTCGKKGSPTYKVETAKWFRNVQDQIIEESMTTFSCGVHNIGTHIDLMSPIEIEKERFVAEGIKFDISHILNRPVTLDDLDLALIKQGIYVLFQTNWDQYIGQEKSFDHPELAMEVLEYMIKHKVNMIGIDALGLAKGKQHFIFDQYAADHEVYLIENLTNLKDVPLHNFKVYCFPMKAELLEAVPVRIVVEI